MEVLELTQKEQLIERLRKGEEQLSYSSLKCFGESPKNFIAYKLKEKVTTDAMLYGSLVHCLLLTPDLFFDQYRVIDDTDICLEIGGAKPRATTKYKEWYQIQLELNKGKEIIDTSLLEDVKKSVDAINNNYPASRILNHCDQAETLIEWNYRDFNFKGYIDKMKRGKLILDLKTCQNAEPVMFQKTIINSDYYLQAAMYSTGIKEKLPYYIIAVDKSGGVSVHLLEEKLIEFGMERYNYLVKKLGECILNDSWDRSYDFYSIHKDGIYRCDKPSWLK